VLRYAGIAADPAELGVAVPGRRVFDPAGNVVGELRLDQVLTSWGRLYALLREALPDEPSRLLRGPAAGRRISCPRPNSGGQSWAASG
jgi:hypothetical protein